MKFSESTVWETVKSSNLMGLDPYLVMAICQQECEHNGNLDEYDVSEPRVEEGYREKYINGWQKKTDVQVATTTEVLLAASYGTMQTMALELWLLGYFEEWFTSTDQATRKLVEHPYSQIAVVKALDAFCENVALQVKYGILHFVKNKLKPAKGDIAKALDYWNGDLSGKYRAEVLARIEPLKKRLKA